MKDALSSQTRLLHLHIVSSLVPKSSALSGFDFSPTFNFLKKEWMIFGIFYLIECLILNLPFLDDLFRSLFKKLNPILHLLLSIGK